MKDGKAEHITREPEQVKAFRDTWRDGIHSYLTYLRDRLTVARDLLTESGSIFVQIGDENVHRVRAVMDEVFGEDNFVRLITFLKTTGQTDNLLASVADYIVWYAKDRTKVKFRHPLKIKDLMGEGGSAYNKARSIGGEVRNLSRDEKAGSALPPEERVYRIDNLTSQSPGTRYRVEFQGFDFFPKGYWKTQQSSMIRLLRADRVQRASRNLYYVRYFEDYLAFPIADNWNDTSIAGFSADKQYVVETSPKVIERCILMTTDPVDLVLDPTCGSGTTAYVAEQWGRRWITIDTSRVALALARTRIMGARYPYYLLADGPEGQRKEAQLTLKSPSESPTGGDIRQGLVYERVPHITLKSIANNAEIDVIWERWQETLEPLREELNAALGQTWEEWEIPRESGDQWPEQATAAWNEIRAARTDEAKATVLHRLNAALGRDYALDDVPDSPRDPWPASTTELYARWWEARIARQKEIDASIAAKADFEFLYDRPYEDRKKVRVAGPFTVESISPHRVLGVDENDELIDHVAEARASYGTTQDFGTVIVEHLRMSGVQQAHKENRITFSSVTPWPGEFVCADGRYFEGGNEAAPEKRAAIFIGPEFGTVARPDLVAATREAADAGFDVLVACAFNYEAHASEFRKLGRVPILKARMNADLHMAGDLKNTGKGNLFVVFGEPDIDLLPVEGSGADADQFQVKLNGVDVFHPNTGEVHSDGADGIACWFIDTDYDEESFFVRHAYFLGAGDPYKALKTTLKAEINQDAWATLRSDLSRPFPSGVGPHRGQGHQPPRGRGHEGLPGVNGPRIGCEFDAT